ncbi:MAG: branched-chain amino acid ABC transporter permease, partial [Nanoarchaeota archaeon]|nr:branched-chain amino acid ABC transporter permease [Nanoarchaeota archaeon]
MSLFAQLTINGLIAGSIYALVASGFSLIYKTNRFMHFAQGSVVAFCAYILFLFFSRLHLNFIFGALITLIFSCFIGFFIYRFVYLPLQKRKTLNIILLLASLALMILIDNLIQLFFGADVKTIGLIKVSKGMTFLGAIITPLQIVIILISIFLFAMLYLFLKKSRLG